MWQVVDIHVDDARELDLVKRQQIFQNVATMDALKSIYIPLGSFLIICNFLAH